MSIEIIKQKFLEVKKLGYLESVRQNSRDGGLGNTLEHYLGVTENNFNLPDLEGFEIKSKRQFNTSYISLFTKSPSFPKGANTELRLKYGQERRLEHPGLKILYVSVFGNRLCTFYDSYKMAMEINRTEEKLLLRVFDLDEKFLDEVYWTFEHLRKASQKLKDLILVLADEQKNNNIRSYHFLEAELYLGFNFEKFLDYIENGKIMFDIRIGVHSSGKSFGKTHDHGSGFRVKKENFAGLYSKHELVN